MYTNELKNEVQHKLLRNDKQSPNQWIYIPSYVKKNNLQPLIDAVVSATSFLMTDSLSERIYCILNDVIRTPMCKNCIMSSVKFKRYQLGYADYCSVKCRATHQQWQDNVAKTNLTKYGVTHIAQLNHERQQRSENLKLNRQFFDMEHAAVKRRETIDRLYGKNFNTGWTEEAIQTRINNKRMVPVELLDDYREYVRLVNQITKKQPLDTLNNIHLRGVMGKDVDAHHIDHKVSIYDGFMNDVPPEIIGHICNLECIPGHDNIKKGNTSSMTIEQLYENYANARI